MNREEQKQKHLNAIFKDLEKFEQGIFLTLNVLHKDKVWFEKQLEKFTLWLNDFCYGNAYKNGLKRLRIVATTEIGTINQGLHSHIVVMYDNDMMKTFEQISNFIKVKWSRLIGSRVGKNSNLVHVRPIGHLYSVIEYLLKTFYYNKQELNALYL